MKKITLLTLALAATAGLSAQSFSTNPNITPGANSGTTIDRGPSIVLTQSVDPSTVDTGGVACWSSGTGEYRNNSFFRAYVMADFGVTADFQVTSVEWGQGSADDNNILNLNLWTADTDDLSVATFTFIDGIQHMSSSANDLSLVSEAFNAVVPAGSILVFEVNSPDGGTATDVRYFPGFNAAGENDDSYLFAADCGLTSPTTTTDVGFPDNQYVMNVIGNEVLGVGDALANQVSVFPNPAKDVLNVSVPSSIEITNAVLYDVLGKNTGAKLVNGQLNTANLSRGVYILSVQTTSGTITKKIVKE
jgi:hypothetical protein